MLPPPPFAPFFQERAAVADADAAAFFFRDLASANDAEHGAVLTSTTVLPRAAVPALPADGAAVAAVGAMAVAKGRAGPPTTWPCTWPCCASPPWPATCW